MFRNMPAGKGMPAGAQRIEPRTWPPAGCNGIPADVERIVRETFALKIFGFHELKRRWKTCASIDTTGTAVFLDADLFDNVQLEKQHHRSHGWESN